MCHCVLSAAGASRIVGVPALFVFDKDAPSTFSELRERLGIDQAAEDSGRDEALRE